MFFKIIGMIVVGFIVLLVVLFFAGKLWLRHKLGKYFNEIIEMGDSGTPLRISLVKLADYEPSERAVEYIEELKQNNFEILDWYDVPEMAHVNLLGAFSPEGYFVAIYDLPMTVHYDLHAKNAAGTEIGLSNTELGKELDKMPGIVKEYLPPETSIAQAHAKLMKITDGNLTMLDRTNFVSEFLLSYEREMDWRMQRGYSYAEIKRLAEKEGENKEEKIVELQKMQNQQMYEQLDHFFLKKFLKDENISAVDWEDKEEFVYVVHAKSTADDIKDDLFYMFEEVASKYSDLQNGILAFEKINSEIPVDKQYELLKKYEQPIEAIIVLQSKSFYD